MLNIEIDKENGIVIFTPDNKLSQADFEHATRVIDPFIDEYGRINGLIIYTEFFPGWESFSGLISHLSFVKDHHKQIKKIALVTNSSLGVLAENITSHFVLAEIETFSFDELNSAKSWVMVNT